MPLLATDPAVDEVSATTLNEIYPGAIRDNFFLDTPFLAHMRDHCLVDFNGGAVMQSVFIYRPMVVGSYTPGQTFNLQKRQTVAATRFDPKYGAAIVPEYLEEIDVINKGPLAVFSLINTDMENAINSLTAYYAVQLNNHGQATGTGITTNRSKEVNGWIEAVNDGKTPGWDGSYFSSYGGQLRNGAITSALNSIPRWAGDTLGNPGPITYSLMEETYQTARIGREHPNIGACNKACFAYIKERIVPEQRLTQERDPFFGVEGVKMNSAIILPDDYFPSLAYGQNDPDLGNWLTGSFVVPAGADARSKLPASGVTVQVAEVFAWLNTYSFLFRMSNSPLYQFGFTGFLPSQDSTKVVGRVHAMVNLQCTAPRLNQQVYGIAA